MKPKTQAIGAVAVLVRDYDEAIAYYTKTVGFTLLEDTPLGGAKRWVLVSPSSASECRLLLAQAGTPQEMSAVGNQAGGRVFLFLHTDDFWRDFSSLKERGVSFCETPREEPYGTVAVWQDLYGNRWDLVQLKQTGPASQ